MDNGHGPRRSRLRLENRQERPALWPRRAPLLFAQQPARYRLDIWFHGRGETLSELNFIQRRRSKWANSRPGTRSCCIPTAATATPTSSPARSMCSKRSRTSSGYRVDDDRMRPRLLDGGALRAGSSRSTTPIAGSPPIRAPDSPKRRNSSTSSSRKPSTLPAGSVALAHVRLHRLRREPLRSVPPWPTAARSISRSRRPT